MRIDIVAGILGLGVILADATSSFKPARPPAIPLFVRNPYLNVWLDEPSDNSKTGYLPGAWPRFWTGAIVGFSGLVRVDGEVYNWMGADHGDHLVDQVAFEYTSTRSSFIMDVAGKVGMNITFLTPVTANDLRRQSLTFSYLNIEVSSIDKKRHHVQVYLDTSAELSSGDRNEVVEWSFGQKDNVMWHKFWRKNQIPVRETHEQPNWGRWYFATTAGIDGLTYQSASDIQARGSFINNGTLLNTVDDEFRPINSNWPVFGYTMDFGGIGGLNKTADPHSIMFTIGLVQDEAIEFLGEGGTRIIPQLWKSYWDDEEDTVTFFYHDYKNMVAESQDLDNRIAVESIRAGGQDYLTITSLTVRQTFGAVQLTNYHERPMVWMKEISSNSDIQTVDVIFPAFPTFLYLNPDWIKYLLDPLFENQESGNYPLDSAIHDLGTYPVAHGYPDGSDEPMPLEECGNMMILVLAYAQRSGDTRYLRNHYSKLVQWAGYLVEDAVIPMYQLSTDDFAGRLENQTNLALKGIIGLKAMAVIAELTGHEDHAKNYSDIADSYLELWQDYGIAHNASPPHTTLSYGKNDTHGLLYNLYADRVLGLDFVPKAIYDMQSAFYPTVALEYGVPLDTRHVWTKGDWELWCAAIASSETRDMFHSKLVKWIQETDTNRPMTDLYQSDTGKYPSVRFMARPVMGASFGLLVLPKTKDEVEKEVIGGDGDREIVLGVGGAQVVLGGDVDRRETNRVDLVVNINYY